MLVFPPNIEYALFKGLEQEGPLKWTRTLFVVDKVPFELIADNIKPGIEQIYFGAGGSFVWDRHTVERMSYYFPKIKLTIENPVIHSDLLESGHNLYWMCPIMWHGKSVPEGLMSLSSIMSLSYTRELVKYRVFVKIDTGDSTYVVPLPDFVHSDYGDYSGDQLILQKENK